MILDEEKNPIYSASLDSKDAKEICAYIKKDMPDICINLYSNNNWMVEDLENDWVVQEIFGDEHNDKDMLIYAGCGVAMGNASKEVKEIADYVTEQNDKEGLRKVLDQCYW